MIITVNQSHVRCDENSQNSLRIGCALIPSLCSDEY